MLGVCYIYVYGPQTGLPDDDRIRCGMGGDPRGERIILLSVEVCREIPRRFRTADVYNNVQYIIVFNIAASRGGQTVDHNRYGSFLDDFKVHHHYIIEPIIMHLIDIQLRACFESVCVKYGINSHDR